MMRRDGESSESRQSVRHIFRNLAAAGALALSVGLFAASGAKALAAEEAETNDTPATANVIAVNTEVNGSLATNSDVDYYKFSLSEPGVVSIAFSHGYVDSSSTYWQVSIQAEGASDAIRTWNYAGSTAGTSTSIDFSFAAGVYYVKVNNYFWSDQPYVLKLNYQTAAERNWERENNNSPETATDLAVNTSINGMIVSGSDLDYYRFSLSEPGVVSVAFSHGFYDYSRATWQVDVRAESSTSAILSYNYAGNAAGEINGYDLSLAAGTYYIQVKESEKWSSQPYKLTLNYQTAAERNWERENNDAAERAQSLDLNTAINGMISSGNDVDYFRFTLDEPEEVTLSFAHGSENSSSNYWTVSLQSDAKSKNLFSQRYAGNVIAATDSDVVRLAAGTYFVKVEEGSYWSAQPYVLTVKAAPPAGLDCEWWETADGKRFWFENGVRQGTVFDQQSFTYDGAIRGREIYDSASDGWYWLDANADGAKAVNKEVFMPYIYQDEESHLGDEGWINQVASLSIRISPEIVDLADQIRTAIRAHGGDGAGKWVRYDKDGKMIKGWYTVKGSDADLYPTQKGYTYYYDQQTGLMAKGWHNIDGKDYFFDELTGVLQK